MFAGQRRLGDCHHHANQIQPGQGDRLYVDSDVQKMDFTDHNYFSAWWSENTNTSPANWYEDWTTNHYEQHWTNGLGGGGSSMIQEIGQGLDPGNVYNYLCTEQKSWPATTWENIAQVVGTGTFTGDCNPDGTWGIGAPELDFRGSYAYFFGESCDVSDPWPPQINFEYANHYSGPNWEYTEDDQTYTRHAQTKLKLLTGGRAVPHGMCLFKISGEAREILDNRAAPPFFSDPVPPYNTPAMQGIPPQNVRMAGLGNLGADGNRWVPLPDGGTTVEVTPHAAKPFYVFDATEQKYTLHISARGNGNNYTDLLVTTPEFCVGQSVTLSLDWDPALPDGVQHNNILKHDTVKWLLGGTFVDDYYNQPGCTTCSMIYTNDPSYLTNEWVEVWWVSGDTNSPTYIANFGEGLTFANGQSVSVAANGNIKMYRPSVNPVVPYGPFGAAFYTNDYPNYLWLDGGPMKFDVSISSKYHGNFGLSQLVTFTSESGYVPPNFNWTYGDYYLDGPEYYDAQHDAAGTAEIFDTPGQPIESGQDFASYNGDWKDYVRFIPDGGIPVTLGRIDWSWAATADNTLNWSITSDGVDGPTLHDDDSFPVWSHVRPPADPEDQ